MPVLPARNPRPEKAPPSPTMRCVASAWTFSDGRAKLAQLWLLVGGRRVQRGRAKQESASPQATKRHLLARIPTPTHQQGTCDAVPQRSSRASQGGHT
jgi:hypothetical protein